MKELVSILLPASIQAARVHQNTIRHNTYQSFAATVLLFFVLSLLVALRLHMQGAQIGPPTFTIESIPLGPDPKLPQPTAPQDPPRVPASVDGRFTASHDTIPNTAQTITSLFNPTLSGFGTSTVTTSTNSSNQVSTNTGGTTTLTTSTSNEDRFVDFPEVDAEVNLSALQSKIEYPDFMRRIGASGKVVVLVYIDESGKPVRSSIVSSTEEGFNNAAIKAVMSANYKAARNAGAAVASTLAIPIQFSLR